MKHLLRAGLAALMAMMTLAAPALAGQRAALKEAPSASGGVVRLGDLFEDAGAAAEVVVAHGAGPTVLLDAQLVQAVARARGLDWANPNGYRRLVVKMSGAEAAVEAAGLPAAPRPAAPPVEKTADLLTWTHNLAAGDLVRQEDLAWTRLPARLAPGDAARDPDAVVGQAARHALREGAPVAIHDLVSPKVVRRDQEVEVMFSADGVRLVLVGRALGDAAAGETVQVLNTQSKKVIDAVATGPGRAAVGLDPGAARATHFAANP